MKKQKRGTHSRLSKLYYDAKSTGSYGGVDSLKRSIKGNKIKGTSVKNWLSFQDSYVLHKPIKSKFARRKTIVSNIDSQWQADLIDVSGLKKANDGYVFLLTCVDILSRYAWVRPLKNKTGISITAAFKDIFSSGRRPDALQTDKGSEFKNKAFQKFLTHHGVDFFTSENEDIKAGICERFNRTLKSRLWRMFTKKASVRYVEHLPHLVTSYNDSYHSSVKRSPASVNRTNEEEVWQSLFGMGSRKTAAPKKNVTFKTGDTVLMAKGKRAFKKGYVETFLRERFTISKINKTTPVTYVVIDSNGEEIKGSFYSQELQRINIAK